MEHDINSKPIVVSFEDIGSVITEWVEKLTKEERDKIILDIGLFSVSIYTYPYNLYVSSNPEKHLFLNTETNSMYANGLNSKDMIFGYINTLLTSIVKTMKNKQDIKEENIVNKSVNLADTRTNKFIDF